MQYRKDKSGSDFSVLGFGCMRFAKKGGGIGAARKFMFRKAGQ